MDYRNVWTKHRWDRQYSAESAWAAGVTADDADLVARLLVAYRKTFSLEAYGEGMWRSFLESHHCPLHEIFMSGDVEATARILRAPGRSMLHYGFDHVKTDIDRLAESKTDRQESNAILKMCLVTLAEALGARPIENPETYSYVRATDDPAVDELLRKIDAVLAHTTQW